MIWQAVHAGFGYFQREAGYTRTGSHGTRVHGRETGQWHEAGPGGGALAAAHLPRRRHAAARPLPDRPRRQDGYRREVAGAGLPGLQRAHRRGRRDRLPAPGRSPHRTGSAWSGPPATTATGSRSRASAGEMMRLFSSRRESITADLRVRAARFEQRYGRAPSQRELAQLAQASNFKTRNPKHGALDLAQAHAGWADKLARTLGVSLASVAPSVWHAATGRAAAHAHGAQARLLPKARAGARGAESGRAGPAGKEHLDPRRRDQVPGPRPAPDRPGPGRGRRAAGRPGRPGAGARSSSRSPAWKHPSRPKSRAACCAPTGAASTSGTAAPGTPPARSWSWKNACSPKPARTTRRA